MIDVIIPAYNAHKTIERTLYSIAYQRNSDDLNVYIVNDGSDKDYSEFIDFFSKFINIKELKLNKNMGPGIARQYGIDNSYGEFIVFIDSDDMFSSPLSLITLEKSIKRSDADLVSGVFFEETKEGEYIKYDGDMIALHGKIYKRKFLEDNNIRFPSFYPEEDSVFNKMIILNNAKIVYIEDKLYVWMHNEFSITRDGTKYQKNRMYGYSKAMSYVIEYGYNNPKVKLKDIIKFSYETLLMIYFSLDEKLEKRIAKKLKKIKEIYLKNFDELSEEEKLDIYKYQIDCIVYEGKYNNVINPKITFDDFLNLIDEEG